MSDLLINTQDAYTTWGVRMGEGFLDVLGASSPMKEFIENKSRLEHGKRVIINDPKIDEREITLSFTIEGNSQSDYQAKKKAFFEELYKGVVDIQVPANSNESRYRRRVERAVYSIADCRRRDKESEYYSISIT